MRHWAVGKCFDQQLFNNQFAQAQLKTKTYVYFTGRRLFSAILFVLTCLSSHLAGL